MKETFKLSMMLAVANTSPPAGGRTSNDTVTLPAATPVTAMRVVFVDAYAAMALRRTQARLGRAA